MKEILQFIGMILAITIAIIGYIFAISRYKSSNKDNIAEANLFKDLTASSAIAVIILVLFVVISMFL